MGKRDWREGGDRLAQESLRAGSRVEAGHCVSAYRLLRVVESYEFFGSISDLPRPQGPVPRELSCSLRACVAEAVRGEGPACADPAIDGYRSALLQQDRLRRSGESR